MRSESTRSSWIRALGKAAVMAGLLAGTLAAVTPSVAAAVSKGRAHDNGWHRGHYGHGRRFVAIPRHRPYAYRQYYYGRRYFAPHHHDHVVYRFPVWVGGRMVYRPYAYCGDRLFVGATVRLPRIVIGFNGYSGGDNDSAYDDRYDNRYDDRDDDDDDDGNDG